MATIDTPFHFAHRYFFDLFLYFATPHEVRITLYTLNVTTKYTLYFHPPPYSPPLAPANNSEQRYYFTPLRFDGFIICHYIPHCSAKVTPNYQNKDFAALSSCTAISKKYHSHFIINKKSEGQNKFMITK
jgi:hypothetical protein